MVNVIYRWIEMMIKKYIKYMIIRYIIILICALRDY